jgi:hypothetical protein
MDLLAAIKREEQLARLVITALIEWCLTPASTG